MESRTISVTDDDVEIVDAGGGGSDTIATYFAEASKGYDREVKYV